MIKLAYFILPMTLIIIVCAKPVKIIKIADGYNYIYDEWDGSIRYKENVIEFECSDENMVSKPFGYLISYTWDFTEVKMTNCLLPTTKTLATTFDHLNISFGSIDTLRIYTNQISPLAKGNYLQLLKLKKLYIEAPKIENQDYFVNNPDILDPLTELKALVVNGTTVPPIADHLSIESLELTDSAILKKWTNCQNLKELVLTRYTGVLPNWPVNCSGLERLQLTDMNNKLAKAIVETISPGVTSLKSLHIENCQLADLTIIRNISDHLHYLNLTNNRLDDKALKLLQYMRKITVLDLSQNKFNGFLLFNVIDLLGSVKKLVLDDNSITNAFCSIHSRLKSFASSLRNLEYLSLGGMPIDPDCFKDVHFNKLNYLSFNHNETIRNLKLQNFPTTNASNLEVNLEKRFLTSINFEKEDYDLVVAGNVSSFWPFNDHYKKRLTIYAKNIDCDCDNYWLYRAIKENYNLVSLPISHCQDLNTPFLEADPSILNCNIGIWDDCIIRTIPVMGHEAGIKSKNCTIECHNSRTRYIDYPIYDEGYYKLIGLNISNNTVSSLNDFNELADTLEWVDLRNNKILRLLPNETAKLFKFPKRRVWLSNNLFICDCESKLMLDELHKYRDQIEDFDDLMCIDSGRPLRLVTSYEACQIGLRIAMGILGVIILVLLILISLLWYYRLQVRIYLYSRGWCLSCLSEDDTDPDRPFDVFLSFSHEDWDYVTGDLLPKLEGEPNFYRVCVHYRDWNIGDWIPMQIMRSVSLSKRTIIVLSRNFIKSLWGSLEFRYAVANAAKESRPRLLVLILDDVLSEEVDSELQVYLENNTYLPCDDPWFWEKLRYAMPHRKNLTTEPHNIPPEAYNIADLNEAMTMGPLQNQPTPVIETS